MTTAAVAPSQLSPGRLDVPAVQFDQLVIRYGELEAVRELSLTVAAGRITALLGANGAGKSSAVKALCTVLEPTAGRIRVFGHDTRSEPMAVRALLGVVFQESTLDPDLSIERNLRFHARLYGVPRAEAGRRIDALLDSFGLADRRRAAVHTLSGGLARRVEIARALLHHPRLLVLDEPTVGLDPESRRSVWEDLRLLCKQRQLTVLYSTHYMDETELADQVAIVRDGALVREGTPKALKAALGASQVLIRTADDRRAVENLRAAGHHAELRPDGEGLPSVSVRTDDPEATVPVVVAAARVAISSLTVRHPSMDDVFLEAAGAGLDAHPTHSPEEPPR
ncbi:ABC transporter ATP-binding protein [Kitasatospora sp. NPDC059795]|uniref:ABC transporter ATP-binding protein n=1 Tax=Kitasatospora sp. NPDC059795 TaxID=3346949 RepID=UPI0036476A9C